MILKCMSCALDSRHRSFRYKSVEDSLCKICNVVQSVDHVISIVKGKTSQQTELYLRTNSVNMYLTIVVCLMNINYKWSLILGLYGRKQTKMKPVKLYIPLLKHLSENVQGT